MVNNINSNELLRSAKLSIVYAFINAARLAREYGESLWYAKFHTWTNKRTLEQIIKFG